MSSPTGKYRLAVSEPHPAHAPMARKTLRSMCTRAGMTPAGGPRFRHRQHLRERGARRERERDGEDCLHGHGLYRQRPTIAILVGSQAPLPVSLRNDALALHQFSARRPEGFIEPCLPTLGHWVPTGSQWAYEIKHDGSSLHLPPRWRSSACACLVADRRCSPRELPERRATDETQATRRARP